MELITRAPRRLSITISDAVYKRINDLADYEGRSTSNLCAFLLETAVRDKPDPEKTNSVSQHQG
jgi:predicted CopG family antitoxin